MSDEVACKNHATSTLIHEECVYCLKARLHQRDERIKELRVKLTASEMEIDAERDEHHHAVAKMADNVDKYAIKVDKLEAALEASRAAVKSLQSEVMMLDSQRRMEHDRATMRAEESTWAWDELFKLRVTIGALKRKLELSQAEVKRLTDFLFQKPRTTQPPDCCDECGQHFNACHDRDEARCAARTMYRNINAGQMTYLAQCFLMKYPWLAQEKSPPGPSSQPETEGEQERPEI